MERSRKAIASPRPNARPVFWAILVLAVLLKTSISSAAGHEAASNDGTAGDAMSPILCRSGFSPTSSLSD
jgi:hypothetical protein